MWYLNMSHTPPGESATNGRNVRATPSPARAAEADAAPAPRRRRCHTTSSGTSTIGFQIDLESPFSVWGQHTWLHPLQVVLGAAVVIGAIALARWPRHLDLRAFAALSGALLLGVQLTMTHWFYLYIPWFLPFALVAMVPEWPASARAVPPASAGAPAPPPIPAGVAV